MILTTIIITPIDLKTWTFINMSLSSHFIIQYISII